MGAIGIILPILHVKHTHLVCPYRQKKGTNIKALAGYLNRGGRETSDIQKQLSFLKPFTAWIDFRPERVRR